MGKLISIVIYLIIKRPISWSSHLFVSKSNFSYLLTIYTRNVKEKNEHFLEVGLFMFYYRYTIKFI